MYRIGLIGDYHPEVVAHTAIPQAIGLAANDLGQQVEVEWIATPTLEQSFAEKLSKYHARDCASFNQRIRPTSHAIIKPIYDGGKPPTPDQRNNLACMGILSWVRVCYDVGMKM